MTLPQSHTAPTSLSCTCHSCQWLNEGGPVCGVPAVAGWTSLGAILGVQQNPMSKDMHPIIMSHELCWLLKGCWTMQQHSITSGSTNKPACCEGTLCYCRTPHPTEIEVPRTAVTLSTIHKCTVYMTFLLSFPVFSCHIMSTVPRPSSTKHTPVRCPRQGCHLGG